jgi:hypothetical protein
MMKRFVGTCLLIYLNFNYSLQLGMAKHRPKSFEFTINKIPTDLQKLSGLFSNTHVFRCRNCNHPIIFPYLTPRPHRCKKCGGDIDWSGAGGEGRQET